MERPSVELTLPDGVRIQRELNDLLKVSGRYRLRPIKANDHYGFALRVRVSPGEVQKSDLILRATLLDGISLVASCDRTLTLSDFDSLVQSPEDPRVAMISARHLAAEGDSAMVEQIDAGNVTTMIEMLRSQSGLMKELEQKLSGTPVASWEAMSDELRAAQERQLARIQREIQENDALEVVGQLLDLLLGLNEKELASTLFEGTRKDKARREMNNKMWHSREVADDYGIRRQLIGARRVGLIVESKYPQLQSELSRILGSINEHLAKFS